jgi:hypothetical protein
MAVVLVRTGGPIKCDTLMVLGCLCPIEFDKITMNLFDRTFESCSSRGPWCELTA